MSETRGELFLSGTNILDSQGNVVRAISEEMKQSLLSALRLKEKLQAGLPTLEPGEIAVARSALIDPPVHTSSQERLDHLLEWARTQARRVLSERESLPDPSLEAPIPLSTIRFPFPPDEPV